MHRLVRATRVLRVPAAAAAALALSLVAAPASADVISPDEAACQGKSAGDACQETLPARTGVCAKATCSRIDYAHWDRDASPTPPSVTYDCLLCDGDGGVTAADAGDGGGAITTRPDGGATTGGASSGGGCEVAPADARGLLGAFLLAAAVPFALARVRRKGPRAE